MIDDPSYPKTAAQPKASLENLLGPASPQLDSDALYIQELSNIEGPLSAQEEYHLGKRIQKGDMNARDRLVKANLRFVVTVAKEFRGRSLSLNDLIAEGNMGLMTAAERFDPDKGYKFISYAVWWIRQAMRKALVQEGPIRYPSNRQEDWMKIMGYLRKHPELSQAGLNTFTLQEVSDKTGMSLERIQRAYETTLKPSSLDAELTPGSDSDVSSYNLLPDKSTPPPDTPLLENLQAKFVLNGLESLGEKEKTVIRLYFGLGEGEESGTERETYLNLRQIGDKLGVTRERVRQIRNRALEKLRRTLQAYAEEV